MIFGKIAINLPLTKIKMKEINLYHNKETENLKILYSIERGREK